MRDNGNEFVFFLLGGLAGASLALLLAPRSGRETRQIVAARMKDGERYARQGLERGRQAVHRTVREGKNLAARTMQTGREVVDVGRDIAEAGRNIVADMPQPGPAEKLT
jgi:gas vesicle protein